MLQSLQEQRSRVRRKQLIIPKGRMKMEYYPDESEYASLHEMMDVDMSSEMEVIYPPTDIPVGKPVVNLSNANNSSSIEGGNITCHLSLGGDQQQQETSPVHSTSNVGMMVAPQKLDLDSSVSNLSWLHSVNISAIQTQQENRNPNLLVNPQTGAPIINGGANVRSQQPVRVITLPNNVQISGGNIQYITVPSSSQQMYITTTSKSTIASNQQQTVANGSYQHGYLASPNSQPSSTVADNPFPKPAYSYSCLIAMALKNSKHGSLPVAEIYNFMTRHFPYFKTAPDGWKNSVRHNLSLNKCFEKIENPSADGTNSRKGCLWALNPAKIKKMDEEIIKWNKKDPTAIKRSMANPEMLELLEKGQAMFLSEENQRRAHIMHNLVHQNVIPQRNSMSSVMIPSPHHHQQRVHSQQQHQIMERHHHIGAAEHSKLAEDAADLFGGHADLPLDPSLSEIALQQGACIWDDLPSDILDIPLSHSPTAFLSSPRKLSPVTSPGKSQKHAFLLPIY